MEKRHHLASRAKLNFGYPLPCATKRKEEEGGVTFRSHIVLCLLAQSAALVLSVIHLGKKLNPGAVGSTLFSSERWSRSCGEFMVSRVNRRLHREHIKPKTIWYWSRLATLCLFFFNFVILLPHGTLWAHFQFATNHWINADSPEGEHEHDDDDLLGRDVAEVRGVGHACWVQEWHFITF